MPRVFDLSDRLLDFTVAVGRTVERLPSTRTGTHVARQLVRCGTAPAAHYAEARGAESRRDFIHKMGLALKELRESLVWLGVADRMQLITHSDLTPVTRECGELIAIFVTSIVTAKRGDRRPRA